MNKETAQKFKQVGIFYFSKTPHDTSTRLRGPSVLYAPKMYVRVELVEDVTLEQALAMADPLGGEMVMNTHPVS